MVEEIARILFKSSDPSASTTSLLHDYLIALLFHDPMTVVGCCENGPVLLFAFSKATLSFYDKLDLFSPIVYDLTITILRQLITHTDLAQLAIKSLSRSANFAISVASMWVHRTEEMKEISPHIIIEQTGYFEHLLHLALQPPCYQETLSHQDLSYFLLSNFYALTHNDLPFTWQPHFAAHLFLIILEEFTNRPTYSLAFLTVSLPTLFYAKLGSSTPPLSKMITAIQNLLTSSQNCQLTPSAIDDLTHLFHHTPDDVPDIDLMNTCRESPSLVATMVPRLREIFATSSLQQAVPFAREMMRSIEDTIVLLIMTHQFFPFLTDLYKMVTRIKNWDLFEPIADLFFSMLFKSWQTGSKKTRQLIDEFVHSLEDPFFQFFIIRLLHCEIEEKIDFPSDFDIHEKWNKRDPPLQQLGDYYLYLLAHPNYDPKKMHTPITSRPFLWLPQLVYSTSHKDERVLHLVNIPLYNSSLFDDLFYVMMMRLHQPFRSWATVSKVPDYDAKLMFPPPGIFEMLTLIEEQMQNFLAIKTLDRKVAKNVLISWRAWIASFGFHTFFHRLLDYLDHFSVNHQDHVEISNMYTLTGMLLISVLSGLDDIDLAEEFLSYLPNTLGSSHHARELGKLIFIVTIGSQDKNQTKKVADKCFSILDQANCMDSASTVFALSFVNHLVSGSNLANIIPESVVKSLIKLNDWPCTIAFYRMPRPIQ